MKRLHTKQILLAASLTCALTLGQSMNKPPDESDLAEEADYIWLDDWQKTTTSSAPSGRIQLTIMNVFSNETAFHIEEQRNDPERMRQAFEMGLEDVNAHRNAFPFFHLESRSYGKNDSSRIQLLREVQRDIKATVPVALIDAVSSSFSMMLGLLTQERKILHISTTAPSSFLSKDSFFPFSLRMTPSEMYFVGPVSELLKHLASSNIAVIYDKLLFSDVVRTIFRDKLAEVNISVQEEPVSSYLNSPKDFFLDLKRSSILIVVGLLDSQKAREVLCIAFNNRVPVGSVTWIIPDITQIAMAYLSHSATCTEAEQRQMVHESFFTQVATKAKSESVDISGHNTSYFQQRLAARLGLTAVNLTWEPQVYDSVWALALAINKTLQGQPPAPGRNFEASHLVKVLRSQSFIGVRGHVGFLENGEPKTFVNIFQVVGGKIEEVGDYDPFEKNRVQSNLTLKLNKQFVWPKNVPKKIARRNVVAELSKPLYIFFCLLASLGLLLCCALLTFRTVSKNASILRSTHLLHNLMALGCACVYACMFFKYTSGEHHAAGCNAFSSLLSLGISLILGSLLTLVWQGHLFFRKSLERSLVVTSEWRLATYVMLFGLIQILKSVVWMYVDPTSVKMSLNCRLVADAGHENENVYHCESFCFSSYLLLRLFVLAVTFVAIEVMTLFLSWQTSHALLTGCSPVTACACNNFGVTVLCGVARIILQQNIDLQYALYSTVFLAAATVNLCLIFSPEIREVCRHFRKKNNRTQAPSSSN